MFSLTEVYKFLNTILRVVPLFFVSMKNLLTLFFIIVTISFYSQEKRKFINGKIEFNNTVVSDVHIVNKNTKQGTIANDNGWFEIPVFIGDSLQFSHINLKSKQLIITKEIFTKKNLVIELEENTYALDEFTLEKQKSIFYIDPQMVRPPIVNAKTLNLPYANTKPKTNNSIIEFSSGGVISIDNLINTLNGNKRRNRIAEKIASEDISLLKIRKYFTDDFFLTDLQIKKEHITPFLNYCIQKNIISYFKRNENILLTKVLMDASRIFPQKIDSDSILASKK